jgi:hypothetical protein
MNDLAFCLVLTDNTANEFVKRLYIEIRLSMRHNPRPRHVGLNWSLCMSLIIPKTKGPLWYEGLFDA